MYSIVPKVLEKKKTEEFLCLSSKQKPTSEGVLGYHYEYTGYQNY
jgi:hypothetical protein